MDSDLIWTTGGIKATTKDFWEANKASFVTANGITAGFDKLLGQMNLIPMQEFNTPFLNAFNGRDMPYGSAWGERVLPRLKSTSFNPKATAEDAFGPVDTEGLQEIYTMSVAGYLKLTIPSNYEIAEMMNNGSMIQNFANEIRNTETISYRADLNSIIGQKLISTTTAEETVDVSDYSAVRKLIRQVSASMHTNKGEYTELTAEQKGNYQSFTNDVLCFIPETLANDMTSDEAGLPSPERLVNSANVIVIPDDAMPTPITTTEYNANKVAQGWGDTLPVAVDKVKPAIFMCAANRAEYRPYYNTYTINANMNGAADCTNFHLIYKGSMGIRGWTNAVRINATA